MVTQRINTVMTAGLNAGMNQDINAGARLDRLPISRFHWKILGFIGAGTCLDAFDVYLAGGVLAATLKSGFSTLQLNAGFISSTFVGMLIGAALAGYAGDKLGRRYSYQVNLAMFGVASLVACFAPNMLTLIGLRFFMGIGLGAEIVVASGTLCEFVPPAHRGRWTALLGMTICLGLLVAMGVGLVVIPALGWRWMFAIAGIGALLVWAARKRMPESPRWLESVGRHDEAEATLSRIEEEVTRQHGTLPAPQQTVMITQQQVSLSILFTRPVIGRTVVAALVCIGLNVAVYGFVAWLPTFFVKEGLTVARSMGFVTLMAVGGPAGALVAYALGDRLGRRKGLILFALAIIAIGSFYPQMRDPFAISAVGFSLVTCIYAFVTLGQYGFIPELFPTAYRLRGTGFAGVCGRTASIGTPYMTAYLVSNFGVTGVLAMVSAVLGCVVLGLLLIRIETNQQSLEDINDTTNAGAAALIDRAPI